MTAFSEISFISASHGPVESLCCVSHCAILSNLRAFLFQVWISLAVWWAMEPQSQVTLSSCQKFLSHCFSGHSTNFYSSPPFNRSRSSSTSSSGSSSSTGSSSGSSSSSASSRSGSSSTSRSSSSSSSSGSPSPSRRRHDNRRRSRSKWVLFIF